MHIDLSTHRQSLFNAKWVQDITGCHLWTAATQQNGYGLFGGRVDGQCVIAHRYAWALANGVDLIPSAHQVHHLCHTPRCVNPAHLALLSVAAHRAAHRVAA